MQADKQLLKFQKQFKNLQLQLKLAPFRRTNYDATRRRRCLTINYEVTNNIVTHLKLKIS